MDEIGITFLLFYLSYIFVFIGLGKILQKKKEENITRNRNGDLLNKLTVIIPFRNEEKRIDGLIDCINNSISSPAEFIFIDDHSTDRSVDFINNHIKIQNYQIIQLPTDATGKKKALRCGISNAKTDYILTVDADIEFSSIYFSVLNELPEYELYLLPVIMKGTFFQDFFNIDHVLVNAFNEGMAGLQRPVIASGANLLFSKKAFYLYDRIETHELIPSGDDVFLLRDFQRGGITGALVSNVDLAVTTESPKKLKEFFNQRIRWISKTTKVKDHLNNTIIVIQSFITFLFSGLLIMYVLKSDYMSAIALFFGKSLMDVIFLYSFFKKQSKKKLLVFLPLYELIFPIYSILIGFSIPFIRPTWKGRKV